MVNFERCTLCQNIIFSEIVAEGLALPLEPYLLTWRKRPQSNLECGLCTLICRCLHGFNEDFEILLFKYNKHLEAIVVIATTIYFAESSAHIGMLCGPFGTQWSYDTKAGYSCAFLSINQGTGRFENRFTSRRILSTNPGSDASLNIAKRWLTECSKHTQDPLTFVPSRLIDVQPSSEDGVVKLVSLSQQDDATSSHPIKYAALSYCWGLDSFLTTTSLNVHAMRQSIEISQLPRTIRDTIKIVRHLGIRYLWVDSLCIIQGADAEARQDWLSESIMMGQVYEQAYFTVSAESASTALAGVLNDRSQPRVDICAIPISLGAPDVIYLTEYQLDDQPITEPLHLRGWTMQETILSRRLLRFGTKEISWSCIHGIQRESRGKAQGSSPCDAGDNTKSIAGQASHIYMTWQTIIEDYSKRVITVDSDKLQAIAGLAKVAQRLTKDIYVAGVWYNGMPLNLLWMYSRRKSKHIRKEEFQAPTWSWASVEGPIQFLRDYNKIEDVVIRCKPCNDHAAVILHKTHDLSITGRMVQLSTIRCQLYGTYHSGYDRYLAWTCFPETLKTYIDDVNSIPEDYKKGKADDPLELVNSWFLLLAIDNNTSTLGAGLILLPERSGRKFFRRVGMFEGFPLNEIDVLDRKPRFKWRRKSPTHTVNLL